MARTNAEFPVGSTLTYPVEKGFWNVLPIPEATAKSWVTEKAKQLKWGDNTAALRSILRSDSDWLNKLAVVIEATVSGDVYAVANMDGNYYLMKRTDR